MEQILLKIKEVSVSIHAILNFVLPFLKFTTDFFRPSPRNFGIGVRAGPTGPPTYLEDQAGLLNSLIP